MRGRGAVLGLVLGAASSLVVGGVAVAADGVVPAGDVVAAPPISLDAPVGIAAVGFGVVGLVVGLLRRRKAALGRAAAAEESVEPRAATGV